MKSIYKQILAITLGVVVLIFAILMAVLIVEMTTHRKEVVERVESIRVSSDKQSDEIMDELFLHFSEDSDEIAKIKAISDDFEQDVIKNTDEAEDSMNNLLEHLTLEAIIAGAAGLILTFVFVFLLSRRIVKPIKQLIGQVVELGGGNLDQEIHVDAKNEIGQLADEFNRMSTDLKKHVDTVQKMAAENERLTAEYSVTREMRNDLLPKHSFSDEHFQICASLRSGQKGGNIYNWIMIDDNHLAIVLADSSGEGVLSMVQLMMAGAYAGVFVRMGYSPSRVMAETNNQLSTNNAVNSSISFLYAVVDLKSGQLSYVNAGAEPILMKHTGEDFAFLSGNEDLPVGQMENIPYRGNNIRLTQGDILIFYTSGIPEARDSKGNFYSREALAGTLDRIVKRHADCEMIAASLMKDVDDFTGDTERMYEGTILAFRYMG